MERKDARGNVRFGIFLTIIAILMVAIAFIWAAIYLSSSHVK
ncbi:MAG: hypothetical protein ACREN7_04585 [Candidatus Dormibacteria bacterium]